MNALATSLRRLVTPLRIACIGHSHTEPVAQAASAAKVRLDVMNFWAIPDPFVVEDGRRRFAPALRARLIAPVFSLVGGAAHHEVGLVLHPRPFDFVWPGNPDLPIEKDTEVIPFDVVRSAMIARTQPYIDIMDMLRDTVDGPLFHMESPPPYEGEQLPPDDAPFYHVFGKGAVFSPIWLRFKLWRVQSEIVSAHCRSIGIRFIDRPQQAVTENGFLRDGLNGTPAHANAEYGALVLAQMLKLARRPDAA